MVDIEEGCLDALVRISTKRLKSVIDGTQCPSDTESSGDDNSDVQQQDGNMPYALVVFLLNSSYFLYRASLIRRDLIRQ